MARALEPVCPQLSHLLVAVGKFCFIDFLVWITFNLQTSSKNGTKNSCRHLIQIPEILVFYITIVQLSKSGNEHW